MQIVRCVIGWDARYTRYIFIKVHTSTIEYYTHQYESMMLSYRNKFNECDLNKNLHILTDLTGDVSSYEQFYSRNTQNIRILVVYTKTRDRNNTIAWESTDFFADFTGHAIPCFHMETMSIHKMYTYVSDPRTQGVRRGSVHCRQHAHDRVRDTKFSLVRYSHTSVFREWRSYFFFYEGTMQRNVRNVLRDVRNYVRHRNVPCLARGCRSSLVPPRPTEKIKIINVSFDAWTFSLTGKRREIN